MMLQLGTQAEPRAPREVPPTIRILHQASWAAGKWLRKHGQFLTLIWLVDRADGGREQFELQCQAPWEASETEIHAALVADVAADLARSRALRFAVAFPADRIEFDAGPRVDPKQHRCPVVALEAHNAVGVAIGCHREILRPSGRPPVLGKLSPLERLTTSRYRDLLRDESHGSSESAANRAR